MGHLLTCSGTVKCAEMGFFGGVKTYRGRTRDRRKQKVRIPKPGQQAKNPQEVNGPTYVYIDGRTSQPTVNQWDSDSENDSETHSDDSRIHAEEMGCFWVLVHIMMGGSNSSKSITA